MWLKRICMTAFLLIPGMHTLQLFIYVLAEILQALLDVVIAVLCQSSGHCIASGKSSKEEYVLLNITIKCGPAVFSNQLCDLSMVRKQTYWTSSAR